MKRFVKIAFLCALYFLCSCENQFNYETSETALLVGEWVCIDSDDMVDIVFTKKHVKYINLGSSLQYMVNDNVIHIWTDPFHPATYRECPYFFNGDTLHIDNFAPTLYDAFLPIDLIKKQK